MALIPVTPPSHCLHSNNITTGLIEVKENPLLYIKQPYLCVIHPLHRFYDRHQNKCIMLAANVSDEELGMNKGIIICFMYVADVTEIYHSTELMGSINGINDIDAKVNRLATKEALPKETLTPVPSNSSFMFHKGFYPKPRITLLDAELSNESRQQLNDILEEISDIMLKLHKHQSNSSGRDGITHRPRSCTSSL